MIIKLDEFIFQALAEYSSLPIDDSSRANAFFEKFGAGNVVSEPNQPYERLFVYERLLSELLAHDFPKYQNIPKGTPFYIMAWLAFDIHNYEKALFYIDAAISEDVRVARVNCLDLPASKFLTLRNPELQVARRTIDIIRTVLDAELLRFNTVSGIGQITTDIFISRFVQTLITDPPKRTIISAFYVFLLEYAERQQELQMRSSEGGSIAPFIHHLFSGALIFESVLKHLFPTKDDGTSTQALRDIFRTSSFKRIYPYRIATRAASISEILAGVSDNSLLTAFETTAKLRNTTGHNLVWDNSFTAPSQYQLLFYQEVNALLYIVGNSF